MSSDYYGSQAGEMADFAATVYWPCCEHCDHDPGQLHTTPCVSCELDG